MPAPRSRRNSTGAEKGAKERGREAVTQPEQETTAEGAVAPAEEPRAESRQMHRSEQAALRRKLKERFH